MSNIILFILYLIILFDFMDANIYLKLFQPPHDILDSLCS